MASTTAPAASDGRTPEPKGRRAPRVRPDGRKRSGRAGRSLATEAQERMLEDILQCRLRPGDMVQLSRLADRYRMSRMPIREALTALQREGLVVSVPYKGYLIRPLDVGDVDEIFFMRQLLEGAAAELAASSVTDDELSRLAALEAPETLIMTLDYDKYARTFHSIIAGASRNQRLEEAIIRTYNDVRRLQYAGIGHPRPDVIAEEHRKILVTLRAHDPDGARVAMLDHIANIRRRALEP